MEQKGVLELPMLLFQETVEVSVGWKMAGVGTGKDGQKGLGMYAKGKE